MLSQSVHIHDIVLFTQLYTIAIGKEDKLVPVDGTLWGRCMLQSTSPPSFYPNDFGDEATFFLLRSLDLGLDDITHRNCKNVCDVLYLVDKLEQILQL